MRDSPPLAIGRPRAAGGRWQKVTVLDAGQAQVAKAGTTFCDLSELGIEAIGTRLV